MSQSDTTVSTRFSFYREALLPVSFFIADHCAAGNDGRYGIGERRQRPVESYCVITR